MAYLGVPAAGIGVPVGRGRRLGGTRSFLALLQFESEGDDGKETPAAKGSVDLILR